MGITPGSGNKVYSATFAGKYFARNGGYTEMERRLKIDYKLKEQQVRLNEIEMAVKPSTFWIALIGLLISVALAIHEMGK